MKGNRWFEEVDKKNGRNFNLFYSVSFSVFKKCSIPLKMKAQ